MSQNRPKFMKGSENEKKFRIMICMLGVFLLLCAVATFIDFFLSLEGMDDLLVKSAFITEDIEELPSGFVDENKAVR